MVQRRALSVDKMSEKGDVDGLIRALRHEDEEVRWEAAEALGEIGDERAVEPLIQALRDNNEVVRESAAGALGEIGDSRAVEPLIQALKDEDEDVRYRAAYALGKIGDSRAVEPLMQTLRDEDGDVQIEAAEALGKMGEKAVEPLIQILKDENEDVRWGATLALGEIGDSRAMEPLIQALRDEDHNVRWGAASALGKFGDSRAVEPLIQALRDEDDDVRLRAAEALGEIGDSRAVEPLIQALKDEDEDFQEAALASIRQLDLLMYRELITKDTGSRLRQFTDHIRLLIRNLEKAYEYSEKFEGDGVDKMEVYIREYKIRKIFADILEKTIDLGLEEAAISDRLRDELHDSWVKIRFARERWQTPETYGLIPEIADEIASGHYPYSFKTEEGICQSVQTAQENFVSGLSEWLRNNRFQVIVQGGWLVWGWREEKLGIRGVLVTIDEPLTIRLWSEVWTEEEATSFLPRFWQFVEELDFGLLPLPRTGRVISWERWRNILAGKGLDTETIRSIEDTLVYCYASSLMGLQSIPPSIIPHLELLSDPEIGLIQVSKCRDDPFSDHEAKSCRIKLARLTDVGLSLAKEIHLGTLDKRIEELSEALSRLPERERGLVEYFIGTRGLSGKAGSWELTVPYFKVTKIGYFPPRFYSHREEKTILPPEMQKSIEDVKEKLSSLVLDAPSWEHTTSGFTESGIVTPPETVQQLSQEISSYDLDKYLQSCLRHIQFLKAKLDLLLNLAPYGLRGHFYNTRPHLHERYGGMIMNVDIRRFAEHFEIPELTILSWLRELHGELPELISKIDERAMDSTEDTVVCNIAEEDRYELGEPFGSIISYPKLVDMLRAENADEAYIEVLENIKEWLNTGKKKPFTTHLKIEKNLSGPLNFSFP